MSRMVSVTSPSGSAAGKGQHVEEAGAGVIIEWKDKSYVLTNRHVTVYEMQAVETELSRIASDHLPVKAVIGVTRGLAASSG